MSLPAARKAARASRTIEAGWTPYPKCSTARNRLLIDKPAGGCRLSQNSTFGAVVFCSYGGFWLSFWYYATHIAPTLPSETAHSATGVFLLAWTLFTIYLTVAAARIHRAMLTTFGLLLATFILLTAGALTDTGALTRVGGFVGLATAVAAWYLSAASVLASTFGRSVLPLGARK
ncbi:acetate uptake transporter [Ammonicoccus fulvus]|uniref:Acetate uptake transporter n=1 Tax=Ammonicoccus fulvus TaxID=3138240 RepID=A0ABZ3FNX0_9ACTN